MLLLEECSFPRNTAMAVKSIYLFWGVECCLVALPVRARFYIPQVWPGIDRSLDKFRPEDQSMPHHLLKSRYANLRVVNLLGTLLLDRRFSRVEANHAGDEFVRKAVIAIFCRGISFGDKIIWRYLCLVVKEQDRRDATKPRLILMRSLVTNYFFHIFVQNATKLSSCARCRLLLYIYIITLTQWNKDKPWPPWGVVLLQEADSPTTHEISRDPSKVFIPNEAQTLKLA